MNPVIFGCALNGHLDESKFSMASGCNILGCNESDLFDPSVSDTHAKHSKGVSNYLPINILSISEDVF